MTLRTSSSETTTTTLPLSLSPSLSPQSTRASEFVPSPILTETKAANDVVVSSLTRTVDAENLIRDNHDNDDGRTNSQMVAMLQKELVLYADIWLFN